MSSESIGGAGFAGVASRGPAKDAASIAKVAFESAGGATALREAYAESPLRLLSPRSRGSAAWVCVSTLGGGLVGGDRAQLSLTVGARSQAVVTTQGPTRVFRSAQG